MGNLVSFPLLCLLNKSCFDIASDIGRGFGENRVGRFNGDDCMFAGDRKFFNFWKEVTRSYGLDVNVEKTGISKKWVEINSQPFFVRTGHVVSKPVLSFLRPCREDQGDFLGETLRGIESFRPAVKAWILNVVARREIALRKIELSSLSRHTFGLLIRRSWFRRALGVGPAPLLEKGEKRTVPMVIGPPPRSCLYPLVDRMSRDVALDFRKTWVGRSPRRVAETFVDRSSWKTLDRSFLPSHSPYFLRKIHRGPKKWTFCWPRPVWEHFVRWNEEGFNVFLSSVDQLSEWVDDHPFLQTSVCVRFGVPTLLGRTPNGFNRVSPPTHLLPCGPANMGFN